MTQYFASWISGVLADYLGKSQQSRFLDLKVWVGLIIVGLSYLAANGRHGKGMQDVLRLVKTMGADLIVLHLFQYYPQPFQPFGGALGGASVSVGTLLVLCLAFLSESFKLYVFFRPDKYGRFQRIIQLNDDDTPEPSRCLPSGGCSGGRTGGSPYERQLKDPCGAPPPPPSDCFTSSDCFLDLSRNMVRVLYVFIGQLIFTVVYINSLSPVASNISDASYGYWVLAIFAVQMAAMTASQDSSQLGDGWDWNAWWLVTHQKTIATMSSMTVRGEMTVLNNSKLEKWTRCGMSFLVNAGVRRFVMYTAPILLMNAKEELDFVKDSLAVTFITMLDNTPPAYFVTSRDEKLYAEAAQLVITEHVADKYNPNFDNHAMDFTAALKEVHPLGGKYEARSCKTDCTVQ